MAFSYVYYVGDGVTDTFAIPFPYLDDDHIHVYVDGEEVPITLPTAGTVRILSGAPPAGAQVKVQRHTPKLRDIDFQNASIAEEANFDRDANRLTYVTQEAADDAEYAVEAARNAESTLFQAREAADEAAASAAAAAASAAAAAQSADEAAASAQVAQDAIATNEARLDNLEGRMDTAESTLANHASEIAGKASQADLNTLEGRVTANEQDIQDLEVRVTAIESSGVFTTLTGTVTIELLHQAESRLITVNHAPFAFCTVPMISVNGSDYFYGHRSLNGEFGEEYSFLTFETHITNSSFTFLVDDMRTDGDPDHPEEKTITVQWKRTGVLL